MDRKLLGLALILIAAIVGGCSEGDGPNDPVVKPSEQKQALDGRMSPEEQARHSQPPSGGGKR